MTKERPIIFNGDMVRTILAGRKTMTRRLVKPQPPPEATSAFRARGTSMDGNDWKFCSEPMPSVKHIVTGWIKPPCSPGDHLWVRETWWDIPDPSLKELREGADTWPNVAYPATDEGPVYTEWGWKKRPSIHMPRWASRITLEVTGVRVERVQEITEEDAEKEGVLFSVPRGGGRRRTFEALWGEIYPGSWERNDWVWVIEFKKEVTP